MTKVRVDRALCQGTGVCASIAGAVFELDPEGHKARVRVGTVGAELTEAVRDAEASCPTGAITVDEDEA